MKRTLPYMKYLMLLHIPRIAKTAMVSCLVLTYTTLGFLLQSNIAQADMNLNAGETVTSTLGEVMLVQGGVDIVSGSTLDFSTTGSSLELTGDWVNAGTFNSGDVSISGSSTSLITGSTTFRSFTCQSGSKTLTFSAGSTQSFTAGLTLSGLDTSNKLILNSSAPGSQYSLDLQSGHTAVSFLDVQDSNLITNTILPSGSTNRGNNSDYWLFSITLAGQVRIGSGPLAGVTVDGGALGSQITDISGNYTFSGVPYAAGYTLTPSKANYTFHPASSSGTSLHNGTHNFASTTPPVVNIPVDHSATNNNTPTISGTTWPSASITILRDGASVGTATASGAGNWSYTATAPWTDGSFSLTAVAKDASNNSSYPSSGVSLTIDTFAAPPAFATPPSGSTTSDDTPTFAGTSEANSTVNIYRNGVIQGSAITNAFGNWNFTPGSSWPAGNYSVTAAAFDSVGNTSNPSIALMITIDNAFPASPVIVSPANNTHTNDTTPTIVGTAPSSGTIRVYVNNISLGVVAADNHGDWSFTPDAMLDGSYTISATYTDAASVTSGYSAAIVLLIDTQASPPVIANPSAGAQLKDNTPTISGTAEPLGTVTVYRNGVSQAVVPAGVNGAWNYTSASSWSDGLYGISARQVDVAGNSSATSSDQALTIDTVAPNSPVVSVPTNGSSTKDNTPTIAGNMDASELGTLVTIYANSRNKGSAVVDLNGAWNFVPSESWSDGTYHINAVATDQAGNTGTSSSLVTVTVDTFTTPPVITLPANGSTTADLTPSVAGTAEAHSLVTVYRESISQGTVSANSSGVWTFTASSAWNNGSYIVKATAIDLAGNSSGDSASLVLNINSSLPQAPVITSPLSGDHHGYAPPTLYGTCPANGTVQVFANGIKLGTTADNGSGHWSLTPASLPDGTYTITAIFTDANNVFSGYADPVVLLVSKRDSDGDGISDAQELMDGTNPQDAGSAVPVLDTTLCTEWNGFLGMWNILEHMNLSNASKKLTTRMYSRTGNEEGDFSFRVEPGRQVDLIVHDLPGYQPLSYGRVCSAIKSGTPGDIDGRMVYYKPNYSGSGEQTGYQFAYAMSFSNGLAGRQFVTFNTFQPSLDPQDAHNLVANWIEVSNMEASAEQGELIYFDMAGQELARVAIKLNANARGNYSGHDLVGASKVGLVEWRPASSDAKFVLRNERFFYQPDYVNFYAAFALDGTYGSGDAQSVPLDVSDGSSSVLEISNVRDETVVASVDIYRASGGDAIESTSLKLRAHQSYHLIVDPILQGEMGLAIVSGSKASSLLVTAMQYQRTATGGVRSVYGIQAKPAAGDVLRGTYNTFLAQSCRLLVSNPDSHPSTVGISMKRYDGKLVLNGLSRQIPAHGLLDYDLCSNDEANVYGVVTVQPPSNQKVFATVLRVGAERQYMFPTPVR